MGQSETDLHEAISTYRKYFKAYHGEINNAKPYVILATFVVTALICLELNNCYMRFNFG